MTINYYLKHCLWGLVGFGYLLYAVLKDYYDGLIFPAYVPYIPYIAAYIALSAVIYPYSFFVSEKLMAMKMKKETRGYYFGNNGPSWNFFIILFMLCGVLSIPLLMLYPLVNRKNLK